MAQSVVSGVQHQLRRGTFSQVSAFMGAVGEVIYDITYNRPVLQDGVSTGGYPQSMASNQLSTSNAAIATGVANVLVNITGATSLTLPLVSAYMPGQTLTVLDAGLDAGTNNITINTNSTLERIYTSTGNSTTLVISVNGKSAEFISNSSLKWVGAGVR